MVTLTFTILITWVASIMVEMFCYHNSGEISKSVFPHATDLY